MISRIEGSGAAGYGAPGFTLIELLVVIVILSLTAVLVIARGPARNAGLEARASASEVVETLRLARSRAIATDEQSAVILDLPTHHLLLDGAPRATLPAWLPLAARMTDGTEPRRAVFDFAPDGSATGGAVVLGEPGRRFLITVDWLTGRVDIANAH
jgi:general secretion pathway protein H